MTEPHVNSTVMAAFPSRDDASRAVTDLRRIGFRGRVGVVLRDTRGRTVWAEEPPRGAGGWAVLASVAGALVGRGVPEGEAWYYDGEVAAGRVLVVIEAGEQSVEVQGVLSRHEDPAWI